MKKMNVVDARKQFNAEIKAHADRSVEYVAERIKQVFKFDEKKLWTPEELAHEGEPYWNMYKILDQDYVKNHEEYGEGPKGAQWTFESPIGRALLEDRIKPFGFRFYNGQGCLYNVYYSSIRAHYYDFECRVYAYLQSQMNQNDPTIFSSLLPGPDRWHSSIDVDVETLLSDVFAEMNISKTDELAYRKYMDCFYRWLFLVEKRCDILALEYVHVHTKIPIRERAYPWKTDLRITLKKEYEENFFTLISEA